jgi:hypothetical protein
MRKLLMLFLAAGLLSCSREPEIKGDKLLDVARQDNGPHAILVRDNGGATVSFVYRVYVVPQSGKPGEVLRADHVAGLSLRWIGHDLQIGMKCGRIFHYANFWDALDAQGQLEEVVPIRLKTNGLCASDENSSELAH